MQVGRHSKLHNKFHRQQLLNNALITKYSLETFRDETCAAITEPTKWDVSIHNKIISLRVQLAKHVSRRIK